MLSLARWRLNWWSTFQTATSIGQYSYSASTLHTQSAACLFLWHIMGTCLQSEISLRKWKGQVYLTLWAHQFLYAWLNQWCGSSSCRRWSGTDWALEWTRKSCEPNGPRSPAPRSAGCRHIRRSHQSPAERSRWSCTPSPWSTCANTSSLITVLS